MATPQQLYASLSGYFSYKEAKETGFLTLTITDSKVETVGSGERAEDKPVLTFAETRKKLPLNKTRLNQLAEIVGPTTDPIGHVVRVGPATVEVNGRAFDMVVIEEAE